MNIELQEKQKTQISALLKTKARIESVKMNLAEETKKFKTTNTNKTE